MTIDEKLDFNFTTLFWVFGSNIGFAISRILLTVKSPKWICIATISSSFFALLYGIGRLIFYCYISKKEPQ
jgi:hypothetical protein